MKGKRRTGGRMIGGKPFALMCDLIRDYSRPGGLVVDPTAGMATTLIAAEAMGRNAIGAEIDKQTYTDAMERIAKPRQRSLLGRVERPIPSTIVEETPFGAVSVSPPCAFWASLSGACTMAVQQEAGA
jgi:hypothetical protein